MKPVALTVAVLALALAPVSASAHSSPSSASVSSHVHKAESALKRARHAGTRVRKLRSLQVADRHMTAAVREAQTLDTQGSPLPPSANQQLAKGFDDVMTAVLQTVSLAGKAQDLIPSFGVFGLVSPATLVLGNITTVKNQIEAFLGDPGGTLDAILAGKLPLGLPLG